MKGTSCQLGTKFEWIEDYVQLYTKQATKYSQFVIVMLKRSVIFRVNLTLCMYFIQIASTFSWYHFLK